MYEIGLACFIYSSGMARQFFSGPAEVSGGGCDYVMQCVILGQVGSDGDGLQMKRAFYWPALADFHHY